MFTTTRQVTVRTPVQVLSQDFNDKQVLLVYCTPMFRTIYTSEDPRLCIEQPDDV